MKTRATKSSAKAKSSGLREVASRHISRDVERELWGRAAGRCEFLGCNRPLWKSPVTQERVNLSEKAHIYAFSADGPRGNAGIARELLNQIGNLILVCTFCHTKIDQEPDGGRYTVELLRDWKTWHERRIEIVTGIDPTKRSHVLHYGANVGDHSSPLKYQETANALFHTMHPADDKAILLATINSSSNDRDPEYWDTESRNLSTQFNLQIKPRMNLGLDHGGIGHLSVFAIAPQPLLIQLGTHLIDLTDVEVYQRHREPPTWSWPETAPSLVFQVEKPVSFAGPPALVLALSAPVTDDRITAVLGPDVAIWRVTVATPHNDLIKSRAQLSDLRAIIRPLLDEIKARHGQTTTLHVFPVAGVSPAIELGRVRMPKAHMPWQLYDQINDRGGFVPALLLPTGA